MSTQFGESQVDWTITRCNRLLRPIVTRIATLRTIRERKQLSQRPVPRHVSHNDKSPSEMIRNVRASSLQNSSDKDIDKDPDWVEKPKRKKIQRRYNIQRVTSSSNCPPEPDTPGPNSLRSRLQPGE